MKLELCINKKNIIRAYELGSDIDTVVNDLIEDAHCRPHRFSTEELLEVVKHYGRIINGDY